MSFTQTIALYGKISATLFKCLNETPKISVVDNQEQGYVLKIKKKSIKRCCDCCCVRYFAMQNNLNVTEDDRYLTMHSTRIKRQSLRKSCDHQYFL